ncbi:hypothetical protein [Virgibacillus ihumii]|uniref:hypothetical protein n=1 Tax=Virgibacillus ihumii TaxID=2686091 RepID=UPI00157BDCC0|nr:hypothetical protein [Virgibacillus ihumii]
MSVNPKIQVFLDQFNAISKVPMSDLIHGFANFTGFVPEAKAALLKGARSLRESFER